MSQEPTSPSDLQDVDAYLKNQTAPRNTDIVLDDNIPSYLRDTIQEAMENNAERESLGDIPSMLREQTEQLFTDRIDNAGRDLERKIAEYENEIVKDQIAIERAKEKQKELEEDRETLVGEREGLISDQKYYTNQLLDNGIFNDQQQIDLDKLASMVALKDGETLEQFKADLAKQLDARNISYFTAEPITTQQTLVSTDPSQPVAVDTNSTSVDITKPVQLVGIDSFTSQIDDFNRYLNNVDKTKENQTELTNKDNQIAGVEQTIINSNRAIEDKRTVMVEPFENEVADLNRLRNDTLSRIDSSAGNKQLTDILVSYDRMINETNHAASSELINDMRSELAQEYAFVVQRGGDEKMLMDRIRSNNVLTVLAPQEVSTQQFGIAAGEDIGAGGLELHFRKDGDHVYAEVIGSVIDKETGKKVDSIQQRLTVKDGQLDLSAFSHKQLTFSADRNVEGENIRLTGLSDSLPARFNGRDNRGGMYSFGSNDDLANPALAFDVVGSSRNQAALDAAGDASEVRDQYREARAEYMHAKNMDYALNGADQQDVRDRRAIRTLERQASRAGKAGNFDLRDQLEQQASDIKFEMNSRNNPRGLNGFAQATYELEKKNGRDFTPGTDITPQQHEYNGQTYTSYEREDAAGYERHQTVASERKGISNNAADLAMAAIRAGKIPLDSEERSLASLAAASQQFGNMAPPSMRNGPAASTQREGP